LHAENQEAVRAMMNEELDDETCRNLKPCIFYQWRYLNPLQMLDADNYV
jgi:hypothetical protein